MPKFVHELTSAKVLFETLAHEKSLSSALIEKDYWVMHCLWGLQRQGFDFEMKGGTSLSKGWRCIERFSEDIDIRFAPPKGLNTKGETPAHIKARFDFYDELAASIRVQGITAERNRRFDDEKARNGGINLKYDSLFPASEDLRPDVLFEVGFARTVPNEPRDFTSWALERVLQTKLEVEDNRAPGVKCFNPEYTFVDKLQTICKRFRQHRDRGDAVKDRPREFLRHYYDLYMLLGVGRVADFIGKGEYEAYKKEKLRGEDAKEFGSRDPFRITDEATYSLFKKEYASMNTLLLSPGPSFEDLIERLREQAPKF